ncbi:MAG: hypothetical protein KF815_07360 [Rhodospirillales bacterium]|nr:hypothetical protein [Rhodospirillales bacterium]
MKPDLSAHPSVERKTYRPAEFMAAYRIARTTFYKQVKAGKLKLIKVGKCSLIGVEEAERWWRARCGEGVANV